MNFYSPPPVIKAELFIRIPDSVRCIGQDSEWRGGFTRQFQDIFLEGPVADNTGNLFVVDVPYGRILQIGQDKQVKICAKWDGEPNGLAATPDGKLLVADYKQVIAFKSSLPIIPVYAYATTGNIDLRPLFWLSQAVHDTSTPREIQRTQRPYS